MGAVLSCEWAASQPVGWFFSTVIMTLPTQHDGSKAVPALMAAWNRRLCWIKNPAKRHNETRWAIHRCHSEINRKVGKGNRAWKRSAANEQAWRASGGFYVTDFI